MAKQKITILQQKTTDFFGNYTGYQLPTGIAINKNSIGYVTVNGTQYGYNTALLAQNTIDFEKDDAFNTTNNNSTKTTIYISRK